MARTSVFALAVTRRDSNRMAEYRREARLKRGSDLSHRRSATTVGSPTDQARVCLVAPTGLIHAVPVVGQSKSRRPARDDGGSPQLGKLMWSRARCRAGLLRKAVADRRHVLCIPRVPRGPPHDLARLWHDRFADGGHPCMQALRRTPSASAAVRL